MAPPTLRTSDTPVVVFLSEKGGVGKTTLCLGLCAHIGASYGQALLVDTDPMASAYDLTEGLTSAAAGYEVVHELDPAELGRLSAVRDRDLIAVDTPGNMPPEGTPERKRIDEVVRAASFVVIPYNHSAPAAAPTVRTAAYVASLGQPYAVLLSDLDPRLGAEHVEDAWGFLNGHSIPAFRTVVRKYRAWESCLRDGYPITAYRAGKYSQYARDDIGGVAAELLMYIGRV